MLLVSTRLNKSLAIRTPLDIKTVVVENLKLFAKRPWSSQKLEQLLSVFGIEAEEYSIYLHSIFLYQIFLNLFVTLLHIFIFDDDDKGKNKKIDSLINNVQLHDYLATARQSVSTISVVTEQLPVTVLSALDSTQQLFVKSLFWQLIFLVLLYVFLNFTLPFKLFNQI